ncbi:hypothetical protein JHK87_055004 [Glycine soja]|nr:hypothetical protein JHK87_055004 [Glycine soja]
MAKECIHKGEKILRNRKGVKGRNKSVVLPLELITEIFLRLPLKSLVRFKCVCKSGDIVGMDGRDGLVKCNDEGQLLEHQSYCCGSFGP